MPLILSNSAAACTARMPKPFSPNGRVATVQRLNQILRDYKEFRALSGTRLKRADQDARIYQHALEAIRIEALAADRFI